MVAPYARHLNDHPEHRYLFVTIDEAKRLLQLLLRRHFNLQRGQPKTT